ncbi:uncharacterized protein J4E79_000511 [Alternaria viburni]|uniref:uncharacterized protein n=1 Tax=Alternaria viburni TaxID=566460 RepID=UPI0020C392B4|nr:uncharacterized protein J4E79_000511 [Alternaria viburni]KAI4670230.1 hypothetical protein J4E79_000511 [Alternaria viburni]
MGLAQALTLQSVERETSGIYEDPEDDSRASSISTDEAGPESPWEVSSDSDVEQTVAPKLQQSKIPRTVINPPLQDHSAAVAETASLDSIKFLVGCLWRIPIRRPAPVDRVRKQATADMSGYLAFDLMHVRAKFPMVDETVAARLAKMISRRRQLLKYRNDHTNLLQDEATADDVQKVARDNKSGPIEYGKTSEATPSVKTHSHHTDITKATTFRPTEPKPLPLPVPGLYAPSIQSMSSVASEQTENDIPVRVPDRPRGKDGRYLDQFICPYCFTGQAITSERRWR